MTAARSPRAGAAPARPSRSASPQSGPHTGPGPSRRALLRGGLGALAVGPLSVAATGCGTAAAQDAGVTAVCTTEILADVVRGVAGPDVTVASMLPRSADLHTAEPRLRALRSVALADVAFSHHLLLEPAGLMRSLEATLRPGTAHVRLSEDGPDEDLQLMPVVENQLLDQIWWGIGVTGDPAAGGAAPALVLESAEGPGRAVGFLTRTFGTLDLVFDSAGDGGGIALDRGTHTHMSWAFTAPGLYRMRFAALVGESEEDRRPAARGEVLVAVGEDPEDHAASRGLVRLDSGHTDLVFDAAAERLELVAETGGARGPRRRLGLDEAVVVVTPKALTTVPPQRSYRVLGRPGEEVYVLPQAVLGSHVHGSLDPHCWHSPSALRGWTTAARDALIAVDPAGAAGYRERAEAQRSAYTALEEEIRAALAVIPRERRRLVTTHDAFAYYARDFDLEVAGFAVPATAAQPGPHGLARLTATLRDLRIPAVFTQDDDAQQSALLARVAGDAGIPVGTLRASRLDEDAPTVAELLRANTAELVRCLAP